jgi:type IV fimbrial biogenesis protein FimT
VRKDDGLTLVELMVTLAAAIIITATVIPNYSSMVQRNEIASAVNEVVSQLRYARSEALKRNTPVTLCPSANGTDCDDWQSPSSPNQYIVFVDQGVTEGKVDGSDELLKRFSLAQADLAVTLSGSASKTYLNFSSKGQLTVTNSSVEFDIAGAASRCLSASFIGRTEISAGTCS